MIVKKIDKKRWVFDFFVKYKIIRELIENQRVLFDPHGHKVLSHVIFPRNFHKCERYGV